MANYNSNSISVISDSTNTVIAEVTLEGQPQGICYDSGNEKVFVTYSESNRISVISDSPLPSPTIPEYPSLIAVSLLVVVMILAAILYRGKHQIETRIERNSGMDTRLMII